MPPTLKAQKPGGPEPAPVRVRDLRKHYGAVVAVDGVSFDLERDTITALLGGNGAGKTTTIAMMLGLVTPSAGEVRVFGADMASARDSVAHRMNFQSPYVDMPMRLTVRQNLTVYARLYGVRNDAERVGFLAEDLDLTGFLDRPAGKLSAGQRTRVGLAKALLNAPELLLLDEPTASLDPDTADWVREKLNAYCRARRATLLIASHNMAEVERLADRVILLHAGKVIEDGSPKTLLQKHGRDSLEDLFLDVVRGRARPASNLEAQPSRKAS